MFHSLELVDIYICSNISETKCVDNSNTITRLTLCVGCNSTLIRMHTLGSLTMRVSVAEKASLKFGAPAYSVLTRR
jgi:hypothetical protein